MTTPTFQYAGLLSAEGDASALEQTLARRLRGLKPGKAVPTYLLPELEPSSEMEEAMRQVSRSYADAASELGLKPELVHLIEGWVQVAVQAGIAQQQVGLRRMLESVQITQATMPIIEAQDPAEPLSANELGQLLGLSDQAVRNRESEGKLFSVLRPGRKRGKEYPAFQAWPGIVGEPLETVLSAMGRIGGADAYGFFLPKSELLAGLTPVEVMQGAVLNERSLEPAARALLQASPAERLQKVREAAAVYATRLEG